MMKGQTPSGLAGDSALPASSQLTLRFAIDRYRRNVKPDRLFRAAASLIQPL